MVTTRANVRLVRLAGGQKGRVTRAQLTTLGIDPRTVARWLKQGYLHKKLPHVYAVGHPGDSLEARLMEAVLYAGPGAMLSHYTAVWWWGLDDRPPALIQVSTPRRCRSLPGLEVHERRRGLERDRHKGIPVSTVAQALLDYASRAYPSRLRRALANADYGRLLNVPAIDELLGRGRPGSAQLKRAVTTHRPQLARSRSDLEVAMFELCERAGIPLPEINTRVHSWTVDFLWRGQRAVVEVDGCGNHRSPAQVRRDRRMDLELRRHGLTVLRYSDEQVNHEWAAVGAEITTTVTAIPPGPSA